MNRPFQLKWSETNADNFYILIFYLFVQNKAIYAQIVKATLGNDTSKFLHRKLFRTNSSGNVFGWESFDAF